MGWNEPTPNKRQRLHSSGRICSLPKMAKSSRICRDVAEHEVKLMCVAERGFVPLFSLLLLFSLSSSAHIKQSSHPFFKSSLDLLVLKQRQTGQGEG